MLKEIRGATQERSPLVPVRAFNGIILYVYNMIRFYEDARYHLLSLRKAEVVRLLSPCPVR